MTRAMSSPCETSNQEFDIRENDDRILGEGMSVLVS